MPNEMPRLGYGTWPLAGREAEAAIATAIEVGYRHLDTAQMYGNEAETGRAMRASGVARAELFVVTKVDPGNTSDAAFLRSVEASAAALGGAPVDLLLIHWPPAERADIGRLVARLNEAAERGLARQIGISNFTPAMMDAAVAASARPLVTNQVEFHPLLDQRRLLEAARRHRMTLTAYCPLARGRVLGRAPIARAAAETGESEAAVVLRWVLQQGVVAISMTTKAERMRANLRALAFELSDAQVAAISALMAENLRVVSPLGMAPYWDD